MSPRLQEKQKQKSQRERLGVPKRLDSIAESGKSLAADSDSSSSSGRSSQDLLEKTQETIIPGTELQMPPLPQVVSRKSTSQDDASYDHHDDAGSKENDDVSFGHGGGFSPERDSAAANTSEESVVAAAKEQVDEFDEILVESASEYDFPERFRYFMGPFKITYDNRVAVEYCIIAEAGITVDRNTVANKGQLPKLITEEYSTIIRLLDTSLFESEELRKDMYTRLAGGRMDKYGSKNMWKYWQDMKSDMKKIFY